MALSAVYNYARHYKYYFESYKFGENNAGIVQAL